MRPSKIEYFINIALEVAKRSHDAETQVGSVLVKNDTGAIIATGMNGFVRGAPDHELPNTRPDKYEHIIHSEVNMLVNCARHGIATDNCTLYTTMSPCINCIKLIWQAGITRIVSKNTYRDFQSVTEMKDICVEYKLIDGYHIIDLRERMS